jgi:restriction system protein
VTTKELIRNFEIKNKYTSTGRHCGYQVNLYHEGLKEYKHLSAIDQYTLKGKINNQSIAWKTRWDKELVKRNNWSKEEEAKDISSRAHKKIQEIEKILEQTLSVNDSIDWDSLKYKDEFTWDHEPNKFIKFDNNGYPSKIIPIPTLMIPQEQDFIKEEKILFNKILNKIFRLEEGIKIKQKQAFKNAIEYTTIQNKKISKENSFLEKELIIKQELWQKEKDAFKKNQDEHNEKIDVLKNLHQSKDANAVVEYCEMVLNNSQYPEYFPKKFEIQYNQDSQMLLVDYQLPSLSDIPNVNNARYVKSRDTIEEKYLSQSDLSKLFDSAIYQIALRTLHELFESDTVDAIKFINFNGIVTSLNSSDGHLKSCCIISIQVKKDEFEKINLAGIVASLSYKECFKSLKGVGSSKLSSMSSVKPLLELNKSDKRFRDHYEVAGELSEVVNIAAMDWEDFEHLVREIFEKEFAVNGGEVKVTQASSDGGVDAIAFDPDPIRGGKIVIQAKRYTNTVGVSAVRDLYGTVMNEGATKGILVTTSDFGPDSYNFAKGKPLTLFNGSNLLHLLEKHGHKAKIDLKEAKKTFSN